MTRLPNDVDLLNAYFARVLSRPYDPVAHNCAMFVLGAVNAITGRNPMDELVISTPESEIDVARVLVEFQGVRGLAEAFFAGPADPAIAHARRGDIVIADGDIHIPGSSDRETLGVVDSSGYLAVTPEGLKTFPITKAKGFWRV